MLARRWVGREREGVTVKNATQMEKKKTAFAVLFLFACGLSLTIYLFQNVQRTPVHMMQLQLHKLEPAEHFNT